MKKKIVVIGNSYKFIKIINSLYPKSNLKIYSWRNIINLDHKKEDVFKNPNIILICGYNYQSQWYSYNRYYFENITMPVKLIKYLSNRNTTILYIDTINKLKKNISFNKKNTFSRYEFAKKELGYKLYKNFKSLKILEIPPIKNKNRNADIYGGIFTIIIFNFLIYFKFIKTINSNNLKTLIVNKIKSKNINLPQRLKPIFLKYPRSLFLDRILRFINE